MNKSTRLHFFQRLAAAFPSPKTELTFVNAYTLLVSVVLSAQATDKSVNKATAPLYRLITTPLQMIELGEAALQNYIRTIGLYKTKAKNVIALSQRLMAEYGGQVPRSREALMSLPGVGRKTANVVLNVAFGEPTMPVDTHVFRVSNRTGLAPGKTVVAVEERLLKVVPKVYAKEAHHLLILLGRYICTARAPKCATCPVMEICTYGQKNC